MKQAPVIVPRETQARLERFAALLSEWTSTLNLISKNDRGSIWGRHIADCLQLVPLVKPDIDRGIDMGSGGGFPGLVLALATGKIFDLIESDRRKAAFLREAVRATGAPARVHATRAESVGLPPAKLITARAVAPLPKLLCLAAPYLAADGHCLFMKGAGVDAELTDAAKQWHMRVERFPSQTARGSFILRISELSRAASAG